MQGQTCCREFPAPEARQDWRHWYLTRSAEHFLGSPVNVTSLIPSLDSSGDGVEDYGDVKNSWMSPFVRNLLPQSATVLVVKLRDMVNMCWALRDEGTFQNVRSNVVQAVFGCKIFDLLDEGLLGDANEGVLDSAAN